MFVMRKYEMLGFFIILVISIALALAFWALPSTFILDGIGPSTDSLWQMGKLMFISTLIYAIFEYYIFGRNFLNFTFAKSATMFIGPLLYIGMSYLFDLGMGNATMNNHIITFAIALAVGQYVSYYLLSTGYYFKLMNGYAMLGILLMMTIYISFGKIADRFDAPIFKPMNYYQAHIQYKQ